MTPIQMIQMKVISGIRANLPIKRDPNSHPRRKGDPSRLLPKN